MTSREITLLPLDRSGWKNAAPECRFREAIQREGGTGLAGPKISVSFLPKSMVCSRIPTRIEGRIAIVTTREAGMRWTRMMSHDERYRADGESVWS
jgi:hypothetical protein